MQSRVCNCCKVEKPYSAFAKCAADKTYGVKNHCRECGAIRRKAHYQANRDKELLAHAQYRSANLDAVRSMRRAYQREWAALNPERKREADRQYERAKREAGDLAFLAQCAERARRRHFTKMSATPAWADRQKIAEVYLQARLLTAQTGEPHEVDHIVPLMGRLATGLHVHQNLRVVRRAENRKKSNRLVESLL